MPTYEQCRDEGAVIVIKASLRSDQQPCRLLLALPEVVDWMKNTLPTLKSDGYHEGSASPKEQVAVLARAFVAGEDFGPPRPHIMQPICDGVWRFRTPDLRFDGWFPRRGMFVIGNADTKLNVMQLGRSSEIVKEIVCRRAKLSLDGGIFKRTEDLHELL